MGHDAKKCAELLANGRTYKDALLESGASEAVARTGKAGLTRQDIAELHKLGLEISQVGAQLTPEMTRNFIRGKAFQEALRGKDTAAMLKILGTDRNVAHFQSEQNTAVVITIQADSSAASGTEQRLTIDAPTPRILGE